MSNKFAAIVKEHQASSLKEVLYNALNYHFDNFKKLEKIANPFPEGGSEKAADFVLRLKANQNIKFELLAYLIHARRLKYFINYLQNNGGFTPPTDSVLLSIWNDIMDSSGIVNMLANKWAAHRSVDDRRGEGELFHATVLTNLERTITHWGNDHLFVFLEKEEFYLYHYHPKMMRFVDWVFEQIEKGED